jgi:uncharacterized phage protein (TIGR01671 family)
MIMQKIKIRAWDKGTRTMKYPVPYDKVGVICPDELKGKFCPAELEDINGHRSHISDILMNSDLYIPMLYTGKCDVNDKEIYEGDIVKHNFTNQIYEVFYDDEWGRVGCKNKEDENVKFYIWDKVLEIIGNKFESPELLNKN